MSIETSSAADLTVAQIGFGKAGENLHGGVWRDLGVQRVAYDADPRRLLEVPEGLVVAHSIGDAVLNGGIGVDIVDITTSSGRHAEAMAEAWAALTDNSDVRKPKAWLVEKPVASDAAEQDWFDRLLLDIDREIVFVNENYLASAGVALLEERIAAAAAAGNPLTSVELSWYKNRVPDVLAGRFTDPTLGAYGIEMPHMFAVAADLADAAGAKIDLDHDLQTNDYHKGIHGIPESEATYTTLTAGGINVRIAQGLGPFTMDAKTGLMVPNDNPGIYRDAVATFADGRTIKLEFDPVQGIPRFNTRVTDTTAEGEATIEVVSDNTLKNLIGALVVFAQTDGRQRSPMLPGIETGLHYASELARLREKAVLL